MQNCTKNYGLSRAIALACAAASLACGKTSLPKDPLGSFWLPQQNTNERTMDLSLRPVAHPVKPQTPVSTAVHRVSYSPNGNAIEWVSFDTEAVTGVTLERIPEDASAYLNIHSSELGLETENLIVDPNGPRTINDNIASLSFQRMWRGIKVEGAYVETIYYRDPVGAYRLGEVVNRFNALSNIINSDATVLSDSQVAEVIHSALGANDITVTASLHLVLAVRTAGVSSNDGELTQVMRVNFRDNRDNDDYRMIIKLGNAEVLELKKDQYSANLSATVYNKSYIDAQLIDSPLSHASYSIGASTKKLDADGSFGADRQNQTTVTLTSPMVQTFVSGATNPVSVVADFTDSNKVVVGSTEEQKRGLNAYTAVQRLRRYVMQFLKSNESPFLNNGPKLVFSATDDACNARFFGQSYKNVPGQYLVFYAQSAQSGYTCANTADLNDVIFHEWGHGLDRGVGRNPGITEPAFSEGIGDIIATYMTESANLGVGFYLNDATTAIRSMNNNATFPMATTEEHQVGQIIGGAFWDLRKALIERYGAVKGAYHAGWLFFRHLLTTDYYGESYLAVLRLDDNDANPSTKSPNYCLINKAFAKHGLATDEGCSDDVATDKLPKACDLVLGIKSENSGQATLVVSAPTMSGIKICMGERKDCQVAAKFSIDTTVEGTAVSRIIYEANSTVAIEELTPVTVGRFDLDGTLVAAKTFRISAK